MSTASLSTEQLVTQLNRIREEHGEEAYQQARRGFAKGVILKPNGDKFITNAFPDMDLDELRKEAESEQATAAKASPEEAMMGMIQQQIPNIKTQAQLNTFMAAMDALRTCVNNYFGRDPEAADRARQALNKALDMAAKMPEIEDQLAEMPDDIKSDEAKAFTAEPKEFHEHDKQRALVVELAGITDRDELERWYATNRQTIDEVSDQRLRNELFDSIRLKRKELDDEV
jgi:hypothetical protein